MAFPHCDINDLDALLWLHVGLLSACGILVIASFISQFKEPAPYGRHADPKKAASWGFPIPQRLGHFLSDAVPGIGGCLTVYLLYSALLPTSGSAYDEVRAVNIVLLLGWLLHYLYRGIITPLIMPYSSRTVAVGITLAGIFPNIFFTYLISAQLACTRYPSNWAAQPRFIIGVVLYVIGTAINRWADLKLRAGRLAMRRRGVAAADGGGGSGSSSSKGGSGTPVEKLLHPGEGDENDGSNGDSGGAGPSTGSRAPSSTSGSPGGAVNPRPSGVSQRRQSADRDRAQAQGPGPAPAAGVGGTAGAAVPSQYFIPRGGLYEYVSCPNYLGELVEWTGYAVACWSWPALLWALFGASTFIPRSLNHHRWYRQHFGADYPARRKAMIPFVL